MHIRRSGPLILAAAAAAVPAAAAELEVKIEIPRMSVAEYHAPYVAVWLEKPDQSVAGNLAVWYDQKQRNNEGTKWLKDMRTWWRKTGRDLSMPADGVSGATRAPGEHAMQFSTARAPLDKLPAGEYQLVVEAAREVGGRELLKVPVQWPPKAAAAAQAKGSHELGTVRVTVKP